MGNFDSKLYLGRKKDKVIELSFKKNAISMPQISDNRQL
jgi:hypothetical protein